jgi:predicted Holliday junction resolvase-like endonuclease
MPNQVLILVCMGCLAAVIVIYYQLKHVTKQKKILEHQLPMLAQEMFQTFKSEQLEAEAKALEKAIESKYEGKLTLWKMASEIAIREDAIKRSGATLKGKAFEHFAPWFPSFPFNPGDFSFIGSPVDMVGFVDFDNPEKKGRVIFLEMKTGKSKLSEKQKQIRDAVMEKRVDYLVHNLKDY